jgi:RNA polymerase sigma-70 factor (ECF subfamily)
MKDFHNLYRDYAHDVFRFALYLCGSVAWAEDITSEVFVRAWTRRDSLRMPTVKAYLLTIARNLYLKQLRRERRLVPLGEHIPSREPPPEVCAEQRAELRAVLVGLQALPEIDRSALLMRAVNDMPYVEIAAALGISLSAARVKVHRARIRLEQYRADDVHRDDDYRADETKGEQEP